jgi:hypothetical protein
MKIALCLVMFFLQHLTCESQSGNKSVEQTTAHKKENSASVLTLYKDRCLASMPIKTKSSHKKHIFKVPASTDPQSVLFSSHSKDGLPRYLLRKENEKALYAEIDILHELGFDGRVNFSFTGITWRMHYVIEISSLFDQVLAFNGFVSIDNQSSVDFEKVNLHLIDAQTDNQIKGQNFQEYTVNASQNIDKQAITRLPWVELRNQKCLQDYRLDVGGENLKDLGGGEKIVPLQIWLKFDNDPSKKDLASGDITLYVSDSAGALRYIGNTTLQSTKGTESISLGLPANLLGQLQSSKDSPLSQIKGSLEQTEYKVLLTEKISEAAYRLTIRNYGDKEVTIKIVLPFGNNHGKVIRENMESKPEGDSAVYWPVQVKPKSEVILRYRVQLMQKE